MLYLRIGETASSQLGIDLAQVESDFLNSKNVKNSKILVRDMNHLQELNFVPDVIIFGDTLVHLMNLETAISNLKKVMGKETALVITVPNALFFMNFVYALFKKEHQHPDHSVTFTFKTLTQLLAKNHLKVDDFYFTFLEISSDMKLLNYKGKIMHILVRIMTKFSPVFA